MAPVRMMRGFSKRSRMVSGVRLIATGTLRKASMQRSMVWRSDQGAAMKTLSGRVSRACATAMARSSAISRLSPSASRRITRLWISSPAPHGAMTRQEGGHLALAPDQHDALGGETPRLARRGDDAHHPPAHQRDDRNAGEISGDHDGARIVVDGLGHEGDGDEGDHRDVPDVERLDHLALDREIAGQPVAPLQEIGEDEDRAEQQRELDRDRLVAEMVVGQPCQARLTAPPAGRPRRNPRPRLRRWPPRATLGWLLRRPKPASGETR